MKGLALDGLLGVFPCQQRILHDDVAETEAGPDLEYVDLGSIRAHFLLLVVFCLLEKVPVDVTLLLVVIFVGFVERAFEKLAHLLVVENAAGVLAAFDGKYHHFVGHLVQHSEEKFFLLPHNGYL